MSTRSKSIDIETHKQLAIQLFNQTWDLIEKQDRTAEEEELMLYAANASRYHWGIAGEPLHLARGEWQISRVYALLKRHEPALHHAERSLQLCRENELGAFDTGFAYEAMARAFTVAENQENMERYTDLAIQMLENISKEEDKSWLLKNIATVKTNTLPVF
ncbi:hypothetical protein ACN6MY_01525 [Peribacillus sp. B-H-3]|uniref:hypothetical protein n=1 Tax=Peribacillus sp. B-H-3 TaxID=3400420 RepID=UPI003B025714